MSLFIVATDKNRANDLWARIKSGRVSKSLAYSSIARADIRKTNLESKYPRVKFRIYEFPPTTRETITDFKTNVS